ncbi:hypothetical protein PUW79_07940 [Microbacterium sp. NE2HP2]|uniref:hypothetical protein n=1 Tax=Microbacterium plantarum TaxID=1816425 RepID=UPI002366F964|nr:hypothetical protein [Microbacterium plantarum]MDD7944558.1 hypothetical protein [Microbacterium plantarum]
MQRYYARDYDVQTGRDRETGEYVAIVKEFPSLSWVSEYNRVLAASGLRDLLNDVLEDMYANGEDVPRPRTRELNSIFVG